MGSSPVTHTVGMMPIDGISVTRRAYVPAPDADTHNEENRIEAPATHGPACKAHTAKQIPTRELAEQPGDNIMRTAYRKKETYATRITKPKPL